MSQQHRNTQFTSVSVTPEARAALRRATVHLSAECDKRLSMSEAIVIMGQLALRLGYDRITECARDVGVIPAND